MNRHIRALAITLSVIGSLAAAWATAKEASIFLNSATTEEARFTSTSRNAIPTGLSASGHDLVLRDCDNALKSGYSKSQPRDLRDEAMENCRGWALQLTERNPANGLAWFIAAQSSAWLRDYEAMNTYLLRSRDVTPYYMTIVTARLNLMISVQKRLTPQTEKVLRNDVAALATSTAGLKKLAEIYNKKPKSRPVLTALMENLPSVAQRRFLNFVRNNVS